MEKLSDKVIGGELLAIEWVNHSKEKENSVTSTGRVLSGSETQLSESIDDYSKSNVYDTTSVTSNTYVTVDRRITVNTVLNDNMQFIIRFNKANTSACKLNLADSGIKDLKNADGTPLKAGMIKSNATHTIVFKNNVFYIVGAKLSEKDYNGELDNFITSSGLTLNAGDNTQLVKADKILSKKENVKKLIENAGLTYDVNNDEQVSEAVDIFGKSTVYLANLSGSTYKADERTLTPNILRSGMVFFIYFTSANTGEVKLDLGDGAKHFQNMDGTELQQNMVLAGDIIPVLYNGSKFVSCRKLYFKFNKDNTFKYSDSSHSTISKYMDWLSNWGDNPKYKALYLKGAKHENIMTIDLVLIVDTDGFNASTGNGKNAIWFDLNKYLRDKSKYKCEVLSKSSNTGTIDWFDGNTFHESMGVLSCALYPKDGNTYDEKIGFQMGKSPWKGIATGTVDRWLIKLGLTYKVKD